MEHLCRFRPPEVGRQITWEVTRFCNLLCDHCCTSSGPRASRSMEPSLAAMVAAASQLGVAGITKVQFSGGEPLLHAGFFDIMESIDTERTSVHVASNGYWLPDSVIERLLRAGLHKLSISLDGGDPVEHDLLRRRRGAFAKTVDGAARAVAAGVTVGISVTVTPMNLDSLESLLERLVSIGVTDVSLHSVLPVGRAAEHPELMFPAATATAFRDEVRRLHDKFGDRIAFDQSFGGRGSRSVVGCPAQSGLLHIEPDGDVSPCSWLYKLDPTSFTLGNIGNEPLLDIVDRSCAALESYRSVDAAHCIIPLVAPQS